MVAPNRRKTSDWGETGKQTELDGVPGLAETLSMMGWSPGAEGVAEIADPSPLVDEIEDATDGENTYPEDSQVPSTGSKVSKGSKDTAVPGPGEEMAVGIDGQCIDSQIGHTRVDLRPGIPIV